MFKIKLNNKDVSTLLLQPNEKFKGYCIKPNSPPSFLSDIDKAFNENA